MPGTGLPYPGQHVLLTNPCSETCIKGHRSSSCKHTDRPLFEIKKKGRPVTQCEHCRELRKTRQIHVKCVCESKDGVYGTSGPVEGSSGQGGTKVPARAAFPSGLPEGLLEASVASKALSEGSDSDQGAPTRSCSCKDGATCTCWTPRTSAKRPSRPGQRRGSETNPIGASTSEGFSQPAALVIHAHSGNNRPVLPKPPTERSSSPSRTTHSQHPSTSAHGRSPSHGQSFYSPYDLAYGYAHGGEASYPQQPQPTQPYLQPGDAYPSQGDPGLMQNSGTSFGTWQDGAQPMFSPSYTPLCNCGSDCACPGCLEHNGPNADPAATCVNPTTCSACLECNITALTALSSDITSTLYDPAQAQNVDEWIRQVSSMPDIASASGNPNPGFSPVQPQPDMRFDPSATHTYRPWNDSRTMIPTFSPNVESRCCGGRCKCPAGMCGCPPDCCGCCQGCSCIGCDHDVSSGRTLTFATSGERAPCCGGRDHHERSPGPSTGYPASGMDMRGPSSEGPRFADGSWSSQLLTIPRETLSRASSLSSSKSSPNASTSSSSPIPFSDNPDASHVPSIRRASGGQVQSCCASMSNLSTHSPSGGVSGSPPRPGPSHSGSNPGFDPTYRPAPGGGHRYS
ncbi:hypothetical protein C8Q77DRAFT_718414 [Trametes polyzona]|nr:hypothetical protein C8Q77DRAFT_718414 [Trametes polyzona]